MRLTSPFNEHRSNQRDDSHRSSFQFYYRFMTLFFCLSPGCIFFELNRQFSSFYNLIQSPPLFKLSSSVKWAHVNRKKFHFCYFFPTKQGDKMVSYPFLILIAISFIQVACSFWIKRATPTSVNFRKKNDLVFLEIRQYIIHIN